MPQGVSTTRKGWFVFVFGWQAQTNRVPKGETPNARVGIRGSGRVVAPAAAGAGRRTLPAGTGAAAAAGVEVVPSHWALG